MTRVIEGVDDVAVVRCRKNGFSARTAEKQIVREPPAFRTSFVYLIVQSNCIASQSKHSTATVERLQFYDSSHKDDSLERRYHCLVPQDVVGSRNILRRPAISGRP